MTSLENIQHIFRIHKMSTKLWLVTGLYLHASHCTLTLNVSWRCSAMTANFSITVRNLSCVACDINRTTSAFTDDCRPCLCAIHIKTYATCIETSNTNLVAHLLAYPVYNMTTKST